MHFASLPGTRFPTRLIEGVTVNGSLVTDLGLSPEVWLFLSLLGCVTLFFKFSRIWSMRNLDLLLLFVLAPGMMLIVANQHRHPWAAYIWLFLGSGLWLIRCWADLGLARRPLLEPNLNASGLLCLSVGVLSLLLAETISLPVEQGGPRNPADPTGREDRGSTAGGATKSDPDLPAGIKESLPSSLQNKTPKVIVSRVLASIAHLGLVLGLLGIGWRYFDRPLTGIAMVACYLLLPYTRMAVVDSGQLVPAALIVAAVFWHNRPALAGALIGLAAGWVPACLGLIALWCGFYRRRGALRFTVLAVGVVATCAVVGHWVPVLSDWASALGARSIDEVGLFPQFQPRSTGSFWVSIDASFRLPVLIAYLALVILTMFWPADKNIAELIALSAALLVASQFWYLDKGGTLVMLYLPLAIAMMFRPTIAIKRAAAPAHERRANRPSLSPSS
jgi:hypothetical protein